jgi:hypothetical protein
MKIKPTNRALEIPYIVRYGAGRLCPGVILRSFIFLREMIKWLR